MGRHQHDAALQQYRRDLIQQLKERRERLGLSQRELAARVGITAQSVSEIESGVMAPTLDTFIAMAHILGFPILGQKKASIGRHE